MFGRDLSSFVSRFTPTRDHAGEALSAILDRRARMQELETQQRALGERQRLQLDAEAQMQSSRLRAAQDAEMRKRRDEFLADLEKARQNPDPTAIRALIDTRGKEFGFFAGEVDPEAEAAQIRAAGPGYEPANVPDPTLDRSLGQEKGAFFDVGKGEKVVGAYESELEQAQAARAAAAEQQMRDQVMQDVKAGARRSDLLRAQASGLLPITILGEGGQAWGNYDPNEILKPRDELGRRVQERLQNMPAEDDVEKRRNQVAGRYAGAAMGITGDEGKAASLGFSQGASAAGMLNSRKNAQTAASAARQRQASGQRFREADMGFKIYDRLSKQYNLPAITDAITNVSKIQTLLASDNPIAHGAAAGEYVKGVIRGVASDQDTRLVLTNRLGGGWAGRLEQYVQDGLNGRIREEGRQFLADVQEALGEVAEKKRAIIEKQARDVADAMKLSPNIGQRAIPLMVNPNAGAEPDDPLKAIIDEGE